MRRILSAFLLLIVLVQGEEASSSKRGLAYGNFAKQSDNVLWNAEVSPLTWYYNFNIYPSDGIDPWSMQFVPMMWGNMGNDLNFYQEVTGMIKNGKNVSYVLGFNEPDICYGGGSCIDAVTAASVWKKHIEPLKKHGIKLGAPSVTGGNTIWLQQFYTACNGGCSTDFLPLHYYSDAIGIKEWVRMVHNIYQNMTIWVTEFACPNCSLDVSQGAFNESIAFLDQEEYVTHYSYFGAFREENSNPFLGPTVAMLNNEGGLTDIGVWYLDLPATDLGKKNIGPATPRPTSSGSPSGSSSAATLKIPLFSSLQWVTIIMMYFFMSILR